jgi:cell wall-associated NlpC family hydrolase
MSSQSAAVASVQTSAVAARLEDWPQRLAQYLRAHAQTPFVWGSNDCSLFTCGAIQAQTGIDVAAPFRGQYTTSFSAAKAMSRYVGKTGALSLLETSAVKLTAQYGIAALASPKLAQRGDVVLFDTLLGPALGIVGLDGITFRSVGPDGVVVGAMAQVRRAWRIAQAPASKAPAVKESR